jgi:hypothetical protein
MCGRAVMAPPAPTVPYRRTACSCTPVPAYRIVPLLYTVRSRLCQYAPSTYTQAAVIVYLSE